MVVDPPASRTVPEQIGPYRVERRLGAGGMGEVYRGYDSRLDRPVALKRVRPGARDTERARRRFRREAKAVSRLHHPAVVQVHDWVETDDGGWLVMELVEGVSLRQLLRDEGALAPARAARLVRNLLTGLAAAHALGVIHRDLKAENVMVVPGSAAGADGEGEQPKILDFGLAKRTASDVVDSATLDGGLIGTPLAMSPEQALEGEVDHRTDLFSLGSLLYEMVTGVSPFRAPSTTETLHRLCTARQQPAQERNPDVPAALAAFIDHLLEKDPRRRPQSADEAIVELDAVLAGEGAWGRAGRPERREDAGTRPVSGGPRDAAAGGSTGRGASGSGAQADGETVQSAAQSAGAPTLFSVLSASTVRRIRRRPLGAALTVAAVLAVLGFAGLRLAGRAPEQTYVAVPETRLTVHGDEGASERASEAGPALELTASAVHTALLQGLLGFRGLAAIEPPAAEAGLDDPAALARALAADEVMTSQLACDGAGDGAGCQLVLRRLRGADGRLLWTHGFAVDPALHLETSVAVLGHLRHAYPDAELRPGVPDLAVRPEDYEAYLRLYRRFERRDGLATGDLLLALEQLERSSPRFLNLLLFEAQVLVRRFQEERDPADLERAESAVARARTLAPEDPRVLARQVQLARIGGRLDEASAALDALRRLEPGDARLLQEQALLLERHGEAAEAAAVMRRAVDRLPSAAGFFDLADLLYRQGDVDGARRALEAGLERAPEHYNGLSRLAQLELLSGSPERAAELYEQLVRRSPAMAELSNLGTAYLLLGRADAAAHRFRQAMELAPTSPFAVLNLADAELLLGREAAATALYRQVLELIDPATDRATLLTVRAQALAHLGERQDAVAATQEALRLAPDHPKVLYEAALVYTLIGDEASALWNARRALELGVEPRWLTFPWFEPLRGRLAAADEAGPRQRG